MSILYIDNSYGKYGSTNWGKFYIDKYDNHLFLSIVNRSYGENYFFNVYEQQENIYFANNFEFKFFNNTPPPLVNLRLKKIPFLTNSELDSLKNKFIGTWSATNEPIPNEPDLWGYCIENQYFSIEFDTNTFKMIKGAVINNGISKNPKEIVLNGNWEISPTGNYLKMYPEDNWTRLVTINLLENDYAEFFMRVEAIEKPMTSSGIVKMKKNYKP